MIDETLSWGIDIPLVVADAGYGDAAAFRHGLEERDLPYAVGVSSRHTAHPAGARPVQPVYAGTGRMGESALPRCAADREGPVHLAAADGCRRPEPMADPCSRTPIAS
ncbi:transposase [Streptomyces sp. NPDC052693]|uniref:transposase n=1 Tax=Streptomyces sp. NPDC052693 TaxID=3155814 RepID=UPI00341CF5FF